MKVKITRPTRWGFPGKFPDFEKGTPVLMAPDEDEEFLGWHACTIDGHETFVPKIFVILTILALLGGWMFTNLSEYTRNLFMRIPYMVH